MKVISENMAGEDALYEIGCSKFLVANLDGDSVIEIASSRTQHSDLLPEGGELIGAGFIEYIQREDARLVSIELKWNSSSCDENFGYDRPRENADQILQQVNETIRTWLQPIAESIF